MRTTRTQSGEPEGSEIPIFTIADFGPSVGSVEFDLERLEDRVAIRPYPHRHDFYHIIWVTHGRGRHILDSTDYAVRPNTIFFMSPNQVHKFELPRATGYEMRFSAQFFALTLQNKEVLHEIPFYRLRNSTSVLYATAEQASQLARIIELIEEEYDAEQAGFEDVIRSYLHAFLMQAGRFVDLKKCSFVSSPTFLLTRQFKALMEQHLLTLNSAKEYAEKLNVTERHLTLATKQATGYTANELIRERIMLEAKRLLIHADLPIAEIAWSLQFQDPAYFSRFFRQNAGVTPLEFRHTYAKKATQL